MGGGRDRKASAFLDHILEPFQVADVEHDDSAPIGAFLDALSPDVIVTDAAVDLLVDAAEEFPSLKITISV